MCAARRSRRPAARSRRWRRSARSCPARGGCSELLYLYCGRVDSEDAGGIHGLDHEHEDIRAFVLPAEEAFARLGRGEFLNANLVIPLQWPALNRGRLKKKWS